MALQERNLTINFAQGLDLKTDPFQVSPGRFLGMSNTQFTTAKRLGKRDGFGFLPSLPDNTSSFLTTFNGDLTAIGSKLEALSSGSETWVNRGNLQPCELSVLSLVKNNLNQTQVDTAISASNLICAVYSELNNTTTSYKYTICDGTTGQTLLAPSVIVPSSGTVTNSPRVFALGRYFVLVFTTRISATDHLQYVAINTTQFTVGTATDISAVYTASPTLNFDGVVANNNLYLAWNGSDMGGAVRVTYFDQNLVQGPVKIFAGQLATHMSVCADTSASTAVIWVSFYDSAGSTGYSMALSQILLTILGPTQMIATGTYSNLTSTATGGICTVLYELSKNYAFDSTIPSHQINFRTVNTAGTKGTLTTLILGLGLASKSFVINKKSYVLAAYQSPDQSSYFLLNASGQVVSRIAYQNGGGYLTTGLPSVNVVDFTARLGYRFKDLIASVNKGTALVAGTPVSSVYSQTGLNLVSFTITTQALSIAEIGQNLNLSGGFLWAYDGYTPVEQNFLLYPDSVEATTNASAAVPTGTVTSGSNVITAISDMTGVGIGAHVTGTAIPANQFITAISGSTATFGPLVATGTHVAENITFTGQLTAQPYFYQAVYEWSDNQGNIFRGAPSVPVEMDTTGANSTNLIFVPTLRQTYKTANSVKIVIYRYSAGQPVYYQVTSLTAPLLNDTTIDSVSFTDCQSDANILGNNILYTNGGVVENVGAPAFTAISLFDTRLWGIDAEDPNLLWYSKQVIESTPVEMSDLFTIYVSPTLSKATNSGPMRCIFPMDDKQIIFKAQEIDYLNGQGPDNTGASNQYSQPIFITSSVGCSNQNSIVLIPQGLMFQSDKGIWLLGRDLSTKYIGAPVEIYNSAQVLSAVSVPGTTQVRFTLDNGLTLMYDYFYDQWGVFKGISGISSTIFQGLHTFIDASGRAFQQTPGLYLDGSSPVLMGLTTSWYNLAGLQGYQRAKYFELLATYISPHKLNIEIAYDYAPSPSQAILISPSNYSRAYGGDATYGASSPYGGPGLLEQWKINFSQQKCQAFQITITEVFDPFYGTAAGAGLTLSGLNFVMGIKKVSKPIPAAQTAG